ncbi:MAG: hypothetical protein AB7S26_11935 [Sandaracinaceae bacterium]
MGSFFTNVQVHLGDGPRDALLHAITADAKDADLVEDPADADRTVLVLPPDAGGWVTIYDQRTESQDLDALSHLAALASSATGAPSIAVLVHDSSVLELGLFAEGQRVDRYNSFPDYFDPPPEGDDADGAPRADETEASGHPERWSAQLGADEDALRAAWQRDALFAEDILRRTCEAVGCDVARARTGYRYAIEERALPEGTTALRFRLRERPPHERRAEGTPQLALHAHYGGTAIPLGVGDGLRLGVSVRNEGGPGLGVRVVVWGDAIDRELVAVDSLELLVGDPRKGATHQFLTPERTGSRSGPILVADRPEQAIPAGSLAGGQSSGVDPIELMHAMMSSMIHVNVVGRVLAPGNAELSIGFVPSDAVEGGQVGTTCRLAITPAMRRPLRFVDRTFGAGSQLLRPLAGSSRIAALLVFDVDRDGATALVTPWLDDAPSDGLRSDVYRREAGKRPLSRKRSNALARAQRDMRDELTTMMSADDWSLTFGTGVLPRAEEARVVCLRASSADLSLREAWRARIDALFDAGQLIQAALFHRDPTGESPDVTAYEQACGAAHGVTTLRAWCERWVRVPGDAGLWMSHAIANHLDDETRAALRAIAEVDERSRGVRISLRDRDDMDALEAALSAVLPTDADGREASLALHRPPAR